MCSMPVPTGVVGLFARNLQCVPDAHVVTQKELMGLVVCFET